MSTLWTPGGEHEIPADTAPQSEPALADDSLNDAIASVLPEGMSLEDLTPEQRESAEEMVREMMASQSRLLETEASSIVANHAMGLYELAALHLSQHDADLSAASLAIDALAAIVEALEGRLGEPEPTLRDALAQLRLGFVQVKSHQEDPSEPATETESDD